MTDANAMEQMRGDLKAIRTLLQAIEERLTRIERQMNAGTRKPPG